MWFRALIITERAALVLFGTTCLYSLKVLSFSRAYNLHKHDFTDSLSHGVRYGIVYGNMSLFRSSSEWQSISRYKAMI